MFSTNFGKSLLSAYVFPQCYAAVADRLDSVAFKEVIVVDIGSWTEAGARVVIGRRVLYNVNKVKKYLNEIAE